MAHNQAYMEAKKRLLRQRRMDHLYIAGPGGTTKLPFLRGGAGSYPDAPSRRMALDDDGSIFATRHISAQAPVVEHNATTRAEVNDEDNTNLALYQTGGPQSYITAWLFPELREFDGFFVAQSNTGGPAWDMYSSGDTTNFIDGTWTQRVAGFARWTAPWPVQYREEIESQAVSNVRAVRFSAQYWNASSYPQSIRAFHVYGEISAGETPDRLLWFDQAAALEFAKPLDYGDVPRGSAEDFVTYLKNNSGSLTASSVQVTAEDLYLGSGAWYTFSEGGAYSSTLSLASSIGAGANSPNITVRRIAPDAAALGLHAARAYANVGTWA